ncbi:MAG TPA: TolC family protein, partial [Pyrinomonadaceae bacterium]|nr:TolC family protein [Pyrinomonadaceae bacterium]
MKKPEESSANLECANLLALWYFTKAVTSHRTPRWHSIFAATLLLMTVLLPRGINAQKYQPAPVKTPDRFRGSEAIDQNSIGDLKWFEVFKDPELQNLIKTAMVQNYDLRTAGARINAARANLGLARSDQFPQFEASADLTSTRLSQNGQLAGAGQGGQ